MPQNATLEQSAFTAEFAATKSQRPIFGRLCAAIAITALIAVGVIFRFVDLDSVPGLNGDEAWSGVQAVRFLHGESVAWRTPTGNPMNVFFWGPLVLLHMAFSPSIWLLRSVSVGSGLLTLVANYWLCRRLFDKTTAAISTTLLAVLPVMIAYSRFAWDSSQTPLFATLVVYLSLGKSRAANFPRSYLPTFAVLVAAIVVHPTNVFLLPLAIIGVCDLSRWKTINRKWKYTLAGVFAAAIFVARSPGDLLRFVIDTGRLFSGTTIYRFISGGLIGDSFDASDVLIWSVLALALFGFAQLVVDKRDPIDKKLAWGLIISLTAFFVVAKPHGVEPHYERYAIWMIVPVALVISRGVTWWLSATARMRYPAMAASCAAAIGLLAGFNRCYFGEFSTSGGASHRAFSTGDVDPKSRALSQIINQSDPSSPVTIVSGNWWTRLPIQYLASNLSRVRVVEKLDGTVPAAGETFLVELVGSRDEREALEYLDANRLAFRQFYEVDRNNQPIVTVFQLL